VLRRRNVIDRYEEHTPGSFSVQLAPISAMVDAPRRRRDRETIPAPDAMPDIGNANRRMLRDLAERTLEGLGIKLTDVFIETEMQRQLRALSAAIGTGPDRDERLRAALRAALDQTI
jgi:hypothetical protein